jgi:hypothetical protein
MSLKHRYATILCLALVVGACTTTSGGASASAPPPSPVAVATLTATAITATASPSAASSPAGDTASPGGGGGGAQPTPGSIDPCTLLTTEEASTLMGKKLSAGVSTTSGPDRVCTFRSGVTEVKLFMTPPAPDAATAQKYWDAARAELPAGLPIKDLKLFDRSAFGAGSAGGLSGSAIFVIDGTTFFDLVCELPGCTETASVAAAQLIAGRLP